MADKRSLGEALALSSKELAFIQGSDAEATVAHKSIRKDLTKDLKLSSTKAAADDTPLETARPRERQKRQRSSETVRPGSDDLLDRMLVPLTTRLPNGLVLSLRRMCLEQRLQHAKPDSIQEIVQDALESWLQKQNR